MAASLAAKKILLEDPYVRETQALFDEVTLAIVGVGALQPSNMLARFGNAFSTQELGGIAEAGGVGDISLRFFNAEGHVVKTPLDTRVIDMPIETLGKIDRVIALAGGLAKTQAIKAAFSGCFDH